MRDPVVFLLLATVLGGCSGAVDRDAVPPRLPFAAPVKAGDSVPAQKTAGRADRRDDHSGSGLSSRPLAEFDDPEMQYRLALGYATGHGAPQDDAAAVHWYRLAAGEGHAAASYQLALSYADGRGVSPNNTLAALWYWQAAMQGYAPAQYKLGLGFATGSGIGQDDAQAAKWFRSAALLGEVRAQAAIGVMYVNGRGVTRDPVRGYMWLRLAARAGNESADAALKIIRLDLTADQIADAERRAEEWRAPKRR